MLAFVLSQAPLVISRTVPLAVEQQVLAMMISTWKIRTRPVSQLLADVRGALEQMQFECATLSILVA